MRPAELLLVTALAVAAVPSDEAPSWERVLPGLELSFPRDHGSHTDHRIEWWYVTGQTESEEGRPFGFQFTVFRSGLDRTPASADASPLRAHQVLAAHLAVTDIEGQTTYFADRLRRTGSPLAFASTEDLDVVVEDWSMQRSTGDRLEITAADAETGVALALRLDPRKDLVLHGDAGYSSKGHEPGNASAYTSWTRLATTGEITVDGQIFTIAGDAWFDHEFGTSVLEEGVVGWDWFGLHLDDGRDLMLFTLRREDGTRAPASAGTIVEADGRVRALRVDDFQLESSGSWASPRSDAVYPTRWSVRLPSGEALVIEPRVPDCELGALGSSGVVYWEGPVLVSGDATGRGYGELTGYAGSMEGKL